MRETLDSRLRTLLLGMQASEASDLHLVAGNRPMYRIHGRLRAAEERVLGPGEPLELIRPVSPASTGSRRGGDRGDVDFAFQVEDTTGARRFRANVFSAREDIGVCIRAIPATIPGYEQLNFPDALAERVVALNNGLVLITGATGSGKTTTLAALIDSLNRRGGHRIIIIEEPIEYVHAPASDSIVTQREVGVDVPSFYEGLRSGLRQDPDVILVGEVRDRETAQLALSAAETGHLIFATLHTADAKGAITRFTDLFPSEQHDDIRTQLSLSLRFVIAQHLLPSATGERRVLALEVLAGNFAVRSAIRSGRIEMLDSAIQSGREDGMVSLDAYLRLLLDSQRISLETARMYAKDPAEFGGES
jgi:twitching motility protein PilT